MKDRYKTKKELIRELEELRNIAGSEAGKDTDSEKLQQNHFTDEISYKAFYEYSPLMYFTVDSAGTILSVNPTGADKLGYDREELVGQPVLELFHKEDRLKSSSQLKTCFKNPGRLNELELRKVKKDGTVIWVKEIARVKKDSHAGELATILCEDITERKWAEFLLNTENKVFELVTRNAPVAEILNTLCLEIERQSEDMLCSFLLLDENSLNLRHGAAPSLPKSYVKAIDSMEIGPSVGCCGTAAYRKEPVYVSDIETDPLWAEYKDLALKYGLRSCWSTPIISSDDKVLGTFAMYYREKRCPSTNEIKIIDTTTQMARLALERLQSQELASQLGEILEESLSEIYIFDAQSWKFIQVNKGARKNLGFTPEELKGMTPLDLKTDLSSRDFTKLIKPLLSGKEEEVRFKTIHRRKDGSKYPVEVYLQISDFKGKKVFIANILDITDQNEHEQELNKNLEQLSKKNRYEEIISTVTRSVHSSIDLQEVVENAVEAMNKNIDGADNVSIYFIEGDEAVIQAWRGYPDWFIKSVERIPKPKGFTWKVLGEGKLVYCPDVEKDNVIGKLGKKVGTKSYASMPIKHGDETIGCININSFTKSAFDNEDLKLLDIIANQIAIAIDNARQTIALRESEERYRTLYDKSPIGVYIFNSDLVITNTNEHHAETLKATREQIIGTQLRKIKDQTFIPLHEQALEGKSGSQEGFYRATCNSSELWLSLSIAPLRDGAGRIIGGMCVAKDITERKRLEEELFKKQNLESLGVLAGGIAHDFNNLLTSIMGNISISKMHLKPKDKIYGRLIEAENASLRAKDLTAQLLTFSRGGAPVKEFVHSLGDLIRDTANFAVSGSKVKCEFDFENKIWPAEIDEGQISQVIHNLIINADQAMPKGGIINIKLQNTCLNSSNGFNANGGNYIRITIEDSGIGMTEDLKKKIFDPYFTTKQRGSGLGLATVYSIVKNHDGHITVGAEIGKGTIFDVYIPAAGNIDSTLDTIPNVLKGDGRILIMDDEETVRTVAGEMIKHLGYKVDYAGDGQEAIDKYVSAKETGSPFDAVMIDLTVPGGMGGKEANKRLLEIDPQVKTIVSSGYFNDPVMSEYNKYGFKGVITKPYKIDELSKTIHSVLNGKQ